VANLRRAVIADLFARAATSPTAFERGRVFEQIIDETLGRIPGIRVAASNVPNAFHSEELDRMLIVDDCMHLPLRSLFVLVEAKNWATPVGAPEVGSFIGKLQDRGLTEGILVAASGITGNPTNLWGAHDKIQSALARGISVIVITSEELRSLRTSQEAQGLLEQKKVLLAATRSSIPR
jgi:hypothetical protein